MRRRGVVAMVVCGVLVSSAPAAATPTFSRNPTRPIPGNPAERYAGRQIEAPRSYQQEVPKGCSKVKRKGVDRFISFFRKRYPSMKGAVGSRYRCENLGSGAGYSFHSDGRGLDLALHRSKPAQFKVARQLIDLLLAPDSTGEPAALARRIGIQEIIYSCGYWSASSGRFVRYFLCEERTGNATVEHRDHVHLSFTRRGAAAQSSFWRPVSSVPKAEPPAENG